MSYVATLIVDPAGSAYTRTLGYPVIRDWPEREVESVRQWMAGPSGDVRTLSRPGVTRPTGSLQLMLSAADRVWLRGYMDELVAGATLRVQPNSTDAGTYTDVVLAGGEITERYERVFAGRVDGPWTLTLPVMVTS